MKILRMKATFGCLDEAELVLQPGVNDLVLPNGSGKSTWAAFVLAMFYGIDTSQRAARGRLPEKQRYQPWNGKAMEGLLELEKDGKIIVLQRTSEKGRPMGRFRAYEKETGLLLTGLTAETCGMTLLGVERSVFQRSAFLSGEELAVTQDVSLSQRLENLAAGGDAEDSYLQAAAKLKQWKNRIRYHQSGLLSETEARLRQVEQALAQQDRAESTRAALEQSMELLKGRQRQAAETLQAAEEALAEAPAPRSLILWLWPAVLELVVCGVLLWAKSLWALLPAAAALVMIPIALKRKKSAAEKRQKLEARLRQAKADYEAACVSDEKTAALGQELEELSPTDRSTLMDQWAALEQQRQELLEKEQALELAQAALDHAQAQQERLYAPKLTRLAGEYLQKLTAGDYEGLVLERGFALQVQEGSGLIRPLAALSTGTQNQVWLALRLAMTKLLLPAGTPIWLDDALLTFDADRTALAMAVLASENRQVILMKCK